MKKGLIVSGVIGTLCLLFYAGGIKYFSDRFISNTTYAGVEIGGLTLEEAQVKLEQSVTYPVLMVKEEGKELGNINYKDILAVSFEEPLNTLYATQSPANWAYEALKGHKTEEIIKDLGSIKQEDLQVKLTELLKLDTRTASTDAYLDYTTEQGYFIQKAVEGNEVNTEDVIKEITEERPVVLSVEDYYKKPGKTESDEQLVGELAQITNMINTKVTYDFTDSQHTIPSTLIEDWLERDAENNHTLNYEKVTSYLWTLNDTYATRNKERQFQSTNKGVVTIQPQIYGWEFDVDAEYEQLKEDILAGKSNTREPHIVGRVKTNTLGRDDIGSNYVEIDIAAQHLYLYKDGKLALETPVVTGMPPIMDTIPGAWHILYKEKDATLRGYNPHYNREYATPVDYWVPFDNGGMGIHDANWQSSFGGSVYQTAGSNGCINMPPNLMPTFFSLVEEGIPVIIY